MVIDKDGNTSVIFQEKAAIQDFVANVKEAYANLKNDNLILNLFSLEAVTATSVLEFYPMAKQHLATGRSFVLVTDNVSYDDIPEDLAVVPTLQEAKDLIEMEEIERDLGL